ncbi:tRNA modification GTPase [Seminavis robusta]|uniref:tRNA modification GTPase n=1 Tax=Seminavis robusta TaxID=568900 RepID=A0A9N8EYJ1_9STRA|nr:tRNA modification GTPase [Seminavis robusta]|eukprot:Sro1940_g306640.1 tRNA modification GTPase (536) ;mRNA; r:10168-11775
MDPQDDTIFALSSGGGGGARQYQATALAVIRISGPQALSTLQSMLLRPNKRTIVPRQATLCKLYTPITNNNQNTPRVVLDQALVLYFPQPHSFTGDDVVELHCHGSRAVVTDLLDTLAHLPGHRMAEPGEFTQRAFAKGKLDLLQVEALADLLTADTSRQRQQALTQLDGTLSDCYTSWRHMLIGGLAHAEAVIDFGDDEALIEDDTQAEQEEGDMLLMTEDVQQWNIWGNVRVQMAELRRAMEYQLQDSRRGELVREGLRICIVGPPNAGKSSLFNVLAQKDAAIVSNIAGTTRDVLELSLNLAGIKCVLSDTAGVRTFTSDQIEQEGIARAKKVAQQADVVVAMVEQGNAVAGMEILETVLKDSADEALLEGDEHDSSSVTTTHKLASENVLLVLNKMDLVKDTNDNTDPSSTNQDIRTFGISCHTNEGIDAFLEALTQTVTNRINGDTATAPNNSNSDNEGSLITRARHRQHVQAAVEALRRFDHLSQQGTMVVDMAAEELRLAASELGRVTGAVDVEDILDKLFKDFCIGK